MIPRAVCEAAFRDAVLVCEPSRHVRDALARLDEQLRGRTRLGLAMGKAAFAMARGAGEVARGVAVSNADDGRELPAGWTKRIASHPEPDERSLEAGDAVIDLVASAVKDDVILALISGGASALVERPAPGVTLDRLRAEVRAVMASGAPIGEINRRRGELSAIKGGKLAAMSEAPVVTLAVSDVVGDDLAVIGSGPTIAPPHHAEVVMPMLGFAAALEGTLLGHRYSFGGFRRNRVEPPMVGATDVVADWILEVAPAWWSRSARHVFIASGEPTVRIPDDHGEGGRAQQLALELAKRLRGTDRSAFVAGSDGIDGPAPRDRPAPAGAYVDGATWDAIAAAGIDPDRALARCDSGTALAAVGALVVTGPTGINHADIAIVG